MQDDQEAEEYVSIMQMVLEATEKCVIYMLMA